MKKSRRTIKHRGVGGIGQSVPDPDLVGGEILGWCPTNNRRNTAILVIAINGSITISLPDTAEEDSRFRVVVLRG